MNPFNRRALCLALISLAACGQQLVQFPNPTIPTVLSTDPANGARDIGLTRTVNATFSEPMDPATLTTATFTLTSGATAVAGAVRYSGLTATFQADADLLNGTTYTATITTGATSAAQVETALAFNYSWTFTTSPLVPTVIATSPANGSTGISTGQHISATFNTAMNPSTLSTATFLVSQGAANISGTVAYSGVTATFTPAAALAINTLYTGTITTGAKSIDGIALAQSATWSFTTEGAIPAGPAVTVVAPANGSSAVPLNQVVTAAFNEGMDCTTINTTTFKLVGQGGVAVPGAVACNSAAVTFTPSAPLVLDTIYTATISGGPNGVKDPRGLRLTADYVWTFTTAGAVPTGPAVTVVAPSNGSLAVPLDQVLRAAFNEVVDCTTVNANTFSLKQGNNAVTGVVACNGAAATFTPSNPLAANSSYTATIAGGPSGVRDLRTIGMGADFVWSFTTADTTAPRIISVNPNDGATGICPNVIVRAAFDSAMDANTLTSNTFKLASPAGPVLGAVSYDSASHTASLTPTAPLPISTSYTATVTTGVKDQLGNPLAQSKVWRFSTGASLCQAPIDLHSLSSFVAVAGAGLTNSNSGGVTVLNGDVGLSPAATCLGDGIPCTALDPVINGTLYANDPAGVAAAAKVDLTNAYNDAFGRPPGTTVNDVSGMILPPGVYTSGSSMSIAVGGTLILDAQGNANGVWIFQVGSSLTINDNAKVLLVNGAKASNVFWAIFASSTIGGNVAFKGNVLAGASNSVGTGSAVEGRLLCRTGQITLLSNTITLPAN